MMMDLPPPPKSAYVFTVPFSSIIRIPPENKAQTYKELLCSEEDKANIRELFTAMGEKGYLALLSDRTHMRLLGSQINHVHPLKLLSVLFTDQNLTQCVTIIMDDRLKRAGFFEGHSGSNGLASSLSRESDKGKVFPFLNDFAKDIDVPVEELKPFCEKRDWEGLVQLVLWWKGPRTGMKPQ